MGGLEFVARGFLGARMAEVPGQWTKLERIRLPSIEQYFVAAESMTRKTSIVLAGLQ